MPELHEDFVQGERERKSTRQHVAYLIALACTRVVPERIKATWSKI